MIAKIYWALINYMPDIVMRVLHLSGHSVLSAMTRGQSSCDPLFIKEELQA